MVEIADDQVEDAQLAENISGIGREREARRQEAQRKATERATVRAETTGKGIKRLTNYVVNWFGMLFSNLRFSLTLRIAIHFSGQLLSTTLLALLVFTIAFGVAQYPTVEAATDTIAAMAPADGLRYTESQLTRLPVHDAYLMEEPLPETMDGFIQQVKLALSELGAQGGARLMLYRNTVRGGLVVGFSLSNVLYIYTILFWTLFCL
ncbi:MAG TPA: hypothetical protein PKM89_02905, partial [Bacteroidales bacterium]|nr:hypothetical protein [Bacteroidales bacterium]